MTTSGKTNKGVSCQVNQLSEHDKCIPDNLIERLVDLSSCMDADISEDVKLPDHKLEDLMVEVRNTFKR